MAKVVSPLRNGDLSPDPECNAMWYFHHKTATNTWNVLQNVLSRNIQDDILEFLIQKGRARETYGPKQGAG
jgi:hypothetical protein